MDESSTPDGGTSQVVGFDSWDEMMAWMAANEAAADAHMTDVQQALVADDSKDRHWIRPYAAAGVFIFGIAWSADRMRESSMKYVPAPGPAPDADYEVALAEAQAEIEHYSTSRRERNYLFGDCYSTICPQGELGQTHAVNVWPISEAAFEEARQHGWQVAVSPVDGHSEATPLVVGELLAMEIATQTAGGGR